MIDVTERKQQEHAICHAQDELSAGPNNWPGYHSN